MCTSLFHQAPVRVGLGITLGLALAIACGDDGRDGGGGTAGESGIASDDPRRDDAPEMPHGSCNEEAGQMCVVCHTCGGDGTWPAPAPIIDRTHAVCDACHASDGSVIIHGEESCEWTMDCSAFPPTVNCDDCHTVREVNHLCEECHS